MLFHHLNHKRRVLSSDGIRSHQRPPHCQKPSSHAPSYPRSVSICTTGCTCLKRRCRCFHRISKVSIAAQSILSTRHSLSLVYRRRTERKPGFHFLLTRREISPYDFNPKQPWSFLLYTSTTIAVLIGEFKVTRHSQTQR